MLSRSSVLAFWLFTNPETKVYDYNGGNEIIYWYSLNDRCFMYQKPKNKIRNKPMKARGLCSYYLAYLRTLSSDFDDITEKYLFDMT